VGGGGATPKMASLEMNGFFGGYSDHLYSGFLGVIKPLTFCDTDKIPAKLEALKVTSKKPKHRGGDREENDEVRCARCFQKTFCDVHLQYPIGSTDGTVIQSDLFGMVK